MKHQVNRFQRLYAGYARGGENIPLKSYAGILSTYLIIFGGVLWTAKKRSALPERIAAKDLLQFAVATHEASLLLTRDAVTSPIRAPFTHYQKDSGQGEVDEIPSGQGLREAIGELLTCPYCLQAWIAGSLVTGFVFKPRETRFVVSILCSMAGSSFLHNAYSLLQHETEAAA
jgi:hypothetical protein